jgi:transposase
VESLPALRFTFIDETGINIDMARRYGRATPGERVVEKLPRNTPLPITVIGALTVEGLKATMEIEGSVNKAVFEAYVEQVLAPELHEGEIVLMDNLGSHLGTKIQEVIESRGAQVIYLPTYSPDFNPIEQCWSKLKSALRAAAARTRASLRRALRRALKTITSQNAKSWFAHAGYALL